MSTKPNIRSRYVQPYRLHWSIFSIAGVSFRLLPLGILQVSHATVSSTKANTPKVRLQQLMLLATSLLKMQL